MDEKQLPNTAEAEREIAGILQPEGGRFGSGAKPAPVFRPVMTTVPKPEPETPETQEPEAPPPLLRTVSERLAELHDKLDVLEAKIDLLLAVLR